MIPAATPQVPPDINTLLDATNRGLQAIPHDNLKTVVDEAYTAVGGLGPELSRLVDGSTSLAIDARKNLDPLISLIDQSAAGAGFPNRDIGCDRRVGRAPGRRSPVNCKTHDAAVRRPAAQGGPAAAERHGSCSTGCNPPCRCCWPTWSASAQSRSPTSRPRAAAGAVPAGHRRIQAIAVPNLDTKQAYKGIYPRLQPQPQPAAAVHHRLPAGPAAARARLRGLPGTPGRRPVLPGAAGLRHHQRARRAQHPVRDQSRQSARRR